MIKKGLLAGALTVTVLFGTCSADIPGLISPKTAEAAAQLSKGIGGRAYLNSTGSILVTKIQLPSSIQVSNGTAYIYSGFTGGTEADIGLQYSEKYNVWKPIMKVGSKGQSEVRYLEGESQFTYTKGFRPGSTVQLTIYKNLNGNTRATYWGTNNDGYSGRIISEISQTNVGAISKWKTLATVAVTSEDQRPAIKSNFSTSFTNITIDNKAVTPVIDTQDFAKVTVSGNSVNMSVVK
ncbi:hypothetical protein AXI59_07055 [Bacillus nakamurai]|uniref:YrpD family protein n=1 Tax=Bacillus nakamurai TaxID=1793963 RepID=UPI00077887D5|nr:YrpD family protein [Bacillus nakamurai]KXZ24113.1 hypothetical protein AXI59_07055 [Bacillus nakamurai]MCC9021330.1 hypothetical protein [Bacillus nakamurai]